MQEFDTRLGKSGARLGAEFFDREVLEVAPELLGKVLVTTTPAGRVTIRITEVEAYGGVGQDPGSHAHRRRTQRNSVMFGRGGLLYVYRSYGIHWCANLVTGAEGVAAAVLLRAGEVIAGVEIAETRRRPTGSAGLEPNAQNSAQNNSARSPARPAVKPRDLARGPGRFCAATGIDSSFNWADVTVSESIEVIVAGEAVPSTDVGVSTRTGVAGPGGKLPYRFFLRDDPTVSPHRPVIPDSR